MTENKLPLILDPTEDDIRIILAAKCYLGTKNVNNHMKQYIFTRRKDGIFLMHISKLWKKLILAARVLVSAETPSDIYVTSSSIHGRQPANKLSNFIGASSNMGRFPPGTFTRFIAEPQILVCLDPSADYQAISESSKCNIPVIAFTNSHSSLKYIDIAIPCNNMSSQSIGVMCWLLARAVLRLRGVLSYDKQWDVMPDMFFCTEEVQDTVAENEECSDGGFNKQTGDYGDGSWTGGGNDFTSSGYDDGVNWQNDNAKASGGWEYDNDDGPTSFNFQTASTSATDFGSSDRVVGISAFKDRISLPEFAEGPIDWAEEVPEETTADSTGWGAPAIANQQLKGSSSASWDS